jgi:signal transduction histidine kinase
MPSRRKIHVVDDEKSLLSTFELFLTGAGYQVTSSPSSEVALSLAKKEHFDAVITDIVMPGRDGISLLEALHEMDIERPVILMTGNPSITSATQAVRSGAFDYLAKPVKKDQLLQVVRRAVDRYTLIEEKRRLQEENSRQARMLADSVHKLESLSAAKDRLSALLVHDFKNPLSAIIANLSFLRSHPQIAALEELHECVGDAAEASQGLLRMIVMLLDISRMEEEQLVLHSERLLISDVMQSALAPFRLTAIHRGVRIEEKTEAGVEVMLDRMLIERAIGNLVSNGLRYAPRGGFVAASALREGDKVVLRVENNGPAIPRALRESVFDKYSQVENAAARSPLTRGLGLYFCRLAVEGHHGSISVDDRPGGGVAFRIELPL